MLNSGAVFINELVQFSDMSRRSFSGCQILLNHHPPLEENILDKFQHMKGKQFAFIADHFCFRPD